MVDYQVPSQTYDCRGLDTLWDCKGVSVGIRWDTSLFYIIPICAYIYTHNYIYACIIVYYIYIIIYIAIQIYNYITMIYFIPVLTACQVSAEASSSALPQLTAGAEPLDGAPRCQMAGRRLHCAFRKVRMG